MAEPGDALRADEQLALAIAKSLSFRGANVGPNTAAVLCLAIERLAGLAGDDDG